MNTHRCRSLAALATALACLALMASPAAATAHNLAITSGTLRLHGLNSVVETLPLVTGGTGCSASAVLDTGTGGTVDFTNYTSVTRFTLASGTPLIAIITRVASTPGTLTGTTVTSATITFRLDPFTPLNPGGTDCATTGTRRCRLTFTLTLSGTVSAAPIVTLTTLTLSAPNAAVTTSPPCPFPFATFGGGVASIPGMGSYTTT